MTLSLVAAAGAGSYLGYRWLLSSPRFAVQTIEVRGAKHFPGEAVEQRLAAARGHNLFRIDIAALKGEAEREPWVARADISRELPDHLVVQIEEQIPAAVVELGGLYLADARGRLFSRARSERDDLAGLPVVTGLDRAAATRDLAGAAAQIVDALAVAARWNAGGRPALGELHLDDHHDITLYTLDPAIAVHLGGHGSSEIENRLATFDTAWAALDATERARTTSIHLGRERSPARVTVAFAERK